MLGRLLELRATIAAARRASAKASAELELGVVTENRVLMDAAQWRASASAMLVRIGELQAARSTALLAARTRYLRRRGECQCDELRYAGASAAQLAACMRHCAGESDGRFDRRSICIPLGLYNLFLPVYTLVDV